MECCMLFPTMSLVYESHKVGVKQETQTNTTDIKAYTIICIYIYITLYLRRLFSDQRAFHVDPHETPLPKMVELLSLISTGEGSLWPSSIGISFFTVSPKICCFWASTTSATKETTEPQWHAKCSQKMKLKFVIFLFWILDVDFKRFQRTPRNWTMT